MKKIAAWNRKYIPASFSGLTGFFLLGSFVAIFFLERESALANSFAWTSDRIGFLHELYLNGPGFFIFVFALIHLTSSALGIPGGCTALNILSGAIFGFWKGCVIVYPVTLLSAALVYFIGYKFSERGFFTGFQNSVKKYASLVGKKDALLLVAMRLSPLLPFGILNFLCGAAKLSFGLFIGSTFVGVFFDVVILNSTGAALSLVGRDSSLPREWLYIIFVVLLGGLIGFRTTLNRIGSKLTGFSEQSE